MLLKILFLIGLVLFLPGCSKEGELEEETDIDEADQEEIKDAIQENESEEDEPCLCGACVTCSKATEDSANVHIVKNDGTVVVGDIQELNRTDILLSQCFNGCTAETAENGLCSVTKEDIEGGVWQNTDDESSVDGEETLKQNESYMICTKGFGLIYFVDSGQELRTAWNHLEKYVNEDIMNKIDEDWKNEEFYSLYGSDAFERMRIYMFNYNVIEPASIMMFLCTLPVECGHGKRLIESGGQDYYNYMGYDETTCGAGLMQISASNQKSFLEYIRDNKDLLPEELEEIKNLIAGLDYEENEHTYVYNDNSRTHKKYYNKNGSSTQYIADNYPIESAIWHWSVRTALNYGDNKKETANEFIVKHKEDNLYNTFVCSQMFVNGRPYKDYNIYDEISECENNCQVNLVDQCPKPEESSEHRGSKHHYCFYLEVDENRHRHVYGPEGWTVRGKCWENAYSILKENGDI